MYIMPRVLSSSRRIIRVCDVVVKSSSRACTRGVLAFRRDSGVAGISPCVAYHRHDRSSLSSRSNSVAFIRYYINLYFVMAERAMVVVERTTRTKDGEK